MRPPTGRSARIPRRVPPRTGSRGREQRIDAYTLGGSGIEVSVVGLGGYEFGGVDDRSAAEVRDVVSASLDAGVNWLDTAEEYHESRNESLIGEAIAGIRDRLVVASKVSPRPDGSGLRPREVASACRSSLKRLRTDRIDVYVVHYPDDGDVPLTETWGAMAMLVEEGLVRAIGLSNFGIIDIEACNAERPVDVIQQGLSMIDHDEERPVIARCGELGIAAVVYEPLANGILTGTVTKANVDERFGAQWRAWPFYRRLVAGDRFDRSLAVVDAMRPVAARADASLGQVAIAWALRQPGVTSAICGTTSATHARENAGASAVSLSPEDLAELDAASALRPPPLDAAGA